MLSTSFLAAIAALCAAAAAAPVDASSNDQLPVIDLGYEQYRAVSYNSSYDTYLFSNVRYAQAPSGNLRFRAPQPPKTNRSMIMSDSRIIQCPQGVPDWQAKAFGPIAKYTSGKVPFNLTQWENDIAASDPLNLPWTVDNHEDCLFLDVFTPRKALATVGTKGAKGAPVLVWIHGGGYVLGSKTGAPTPDQDPSGMLTYAKQANELGMLFVALNYRLGALGFLPGNEVYRNGDLNAGLLDQRFALDWIQSNIHLFGGDTNRTTVIGESGGAGSILMQLTAYGNKKVPFQQAIAQSPASIGYRQHRAGYTTFLKKLNASTLDEARQATPEQIVAANYATLLEAPATTYWFGPSFDGKFIPQAPAQALQSGNFDSSVKLLTGVNSFEGGFFFDTTVKTEKDFKKWLSTLLPGMNQSAIDYTTNKMYPPIYDGSQGYTDIGSRAMLISGDSVFYCNAIAMNNAYGNSSYAYEFTPSPGIHIQDLQYTFNNVNVPYPATREALQRAIVSFALTGTPMMYGPNGKQPTAFPRWDESRTIVNISETGSSLSKKADKSARCDWWLNKVEALY